MRFLLDMGIPHRSADLLISLGHDAVHLREVGLHRLPDRDIFRKAIDDERVILTHDLDFGEIMAISGGRLPSVVIFRLRDMRHGNVDQYLERILKEHETALRQGAILSVTESRIRVRALPI